VGHAQFTGIEARGVLEVRHDLAALDEEGFWAVVVTFEGAVTCVRFATTGPAQHPAPEDAGWLPLEGGWTSSLDRTAYERGVDDVRGRIAAGQVYQVNLCRVVSHALRDDADLAGLHALLRQGNPAPYAARLHVPEAGLDLACASPEAFLLRAGERVESCPIKGTATSAAAMLAKDYAENVMITDLVRNDLSHVCAEGSVSVDALCAVEQHPGLVHLVSRVSGTLRDGTTWADIGDATFPPGSVSGAPKSSALTTIGDLEPVPRGPYCGAVGWVDGDARTAELAVGIRTFWAERDGAGRRWLRFGTGAGITWGSDPVGEWRETELKAAHLVGLASGRVRP